MNSRLSVTLPLTNALLRNIIGHCSPHFIRKIPSRTKSNRSRGDRFSVFILQRMGNTVFRERGAGKEDDGG